MIKMISNIVALTLIMRVLPIQTMETDLRGILPVRILDIEVREEYLNLEKPLDNPTLTAMIGGSILGAYLAYKMSKIVTKYIKKKEYLKASALYGAYITAGTIFVRKSNHSINSLSEAIFYSAMGILGVGLLYGPIVTTLADDEVFEDTVKPVI